MFLKNYCHPMFCVETFWKICGPLFSKIHFWKHCRVRQGLCLKLFGMMKSKMVSINICFCSSQKCISLFWTRGPQIIENHIFLAFFVVFGGDCEYGLVVDEACKFWSLPLEECWFIWQCISIHIDRNVSQLMDFNFREKTYHDLMNSWRMRSGGPHFELGICFGAAGQQLIF